MFEHMKNYQALLRKLSTWLRPKAKSSDNAQATIGEEEPLIFIHIFCHRTTPYHFEGDGWMTRNFFSG
jgi:hypothetical protein